jgi:hypothetical protein
VFRHSVAIRIAMRAMKRSTVAVWLLLVALLFLSTISSTFMFWCERGTWDAEAREWRRSDGSRSPFNSIPEGFYWAVTTLVTVGYGDVVPITPAGKFFACLTMFASIFMIVLPTSIVSSNMNNEWHAYYQARAQKKLLKAQKQFGHTEKAQSVRALKEQNLTMFNFIVQAQETLDSINPPQYYKKFKEVCDKYEKARRVIATLEAELERLRPKSKTPTTSPDASRLGTLLHQRKRSISEDVALKIA